MHIESWSAAGSFSIEKEMIDGRDESRSRDGESDALPHPAGEQRTLLPREAHEV